MNLRFVEAFHWAASLRSVTRAAEKLHITQSALSSRIASLEEELGVVLLDRRDKQFRLTVAGQRFQTLAQRLLEVQRQVKEEMGGTGGGAGRPVVLRIGAIESVVHSWLTGWLQEMRAANPDFELELTVETSPVLVDQVRRGAQDLVFAAIPAADAGGVRTRAMAPMPMGFVGRADLHTKRRYGLSDLAGHDLLTFQRASQPHQALLEMFQESGLPLPLAALLAVGGAVLVGLALEKLAVEPARGAPVVTLIIITIGASILLRGLASLVWDKKIHAVPAFSGEAPIRLAGATLLLAGTICPRHAGCLISRPWSR